MSEKTEKDRRFEIQRIKDIQNGAIMQFAREIRSMKFRQRLSMALSILFPSKAVGLKSVIRGKK